MQSNKEATQFAIFDDQQTLYIYNKQQEQFIFSITHLYTITSQNILIGINEPFVYIAERFGLNAVVVNLESNSITPFVREDYHASVSSFAVAFIKHQEQVLLLHQTQWNRLDITDLDTGQCLTTREVYCRDVYTNKGKEREEKNYLDYFHSLLHVSPDGKSFLINGWVWMPIDYIRCGTVEGFLEGYELSTIAVDYSNGYNWDRPATFISDDVFVIAVDDPDPDMLDKEEIEQWPDHQLRFYKLSDRQENQQHLPCFKQLVGDWFTKEGGEVKGRLYFDSDYDVLIAISSKGIFSIDLSGKITGKLITDNAEDWHYNPIFHQFYFFQDQQIIIVDLQHWLLANQE